MRKRLGSLIALVSLALCCATAYAATPSLDTSQLVAKVSYTTHASGVAAGVDQVKIAHRTAGTSVVATVGRRHTVPKPIANLVPAVLYSATVQTQVQRRVHRSPHYVLT